MERKQEEQARQMQELRARAELLQRENDRPQSQVEKSLELRKDVQGGDCAQHLVVLNKGKEPTFFNNEASADNELSSGRSPSMSPLPGRNAWGSMRAKSRKEAFASPFP